MCDKRVKAKIYSDFSSFVFLEKSVHSFKFIDCISQKTSRHGRGMGGGGCFLGKGGGAQWGRLEYLMQAL